MLDNLSTDGTLEWLRSLRDDRIVIHPSSKDLSIEENWARILQTPKNEFITLIGHDDRLNENYLQVMNDLIVQHPSAGIFQAHFQYIDSEGAFIRDCKPMTEKQSADQFLASYMTDAIDSTGTGYMMRAADYNAAGGINPQYENLLFADFVLWITLTAISYIATAAESTFQYRIHHSISRVTGGQEYQQAFEKFLQFLMNLSGKDNAIKAVIQKYGKQFLLSYCESLSHRILKTPRNKRHIVVRDYIEKCKYYARELIPGQTFHPERVFRIKIAAILDRYSLGRRLFLLLQRIRLR